jgi:serine/threonine protein kinase
MIEIFSPDGDLPSRESREDQGMQKLKEPISMETAFGVYSAVEIIGEGGSGRVYGGTGLDGNPVAIKVLSPERSTTEKRKRFKNEIAFLHANRHPNIVTVTDFGLAATSKINGPFYVMPRYRGNLRDLMEMADNPEVILQRFAKILDGVEAAHLQGVIHRDLKPENILWDGATVAVADFGIARFSSDLLFTKVETGPAQRLANFEYAAPEQRRAGAEVELPADIYSLGLMLNEMFTGSVPHGTEYTQIRSISESFAFLDGVVAQMMRQNPNERPKSISEVKGLIQRYRADAVTEQRLSKLTKTVIKADDIDEPLASEPPKLVDYDWENGRLTLILDRPVNHLWIDALLNHMGGYTSVLGAAPQNFSFQGNIASVSAQPEEVQRIINYFKQWLPVATSALKHQLEQKMRSDAEEKRRRLEIERRHEETRLNVLRNVKI